MDGEKSVVQDEKVLKAKSGYAMLLLGIIGMLLGVAVIIAGCMVFGQTGETNTALLAGSIILGVLLIVGFILELCGLRVLNQMKPMYLPCLENITERSRQPDFSG